jgi:hypothetical protein
MAQHRGVNTLDAAERLPRGHAVAVQFQHFNRARLLVNQPELPDAVPASAPFVGQKTVLGSVESSLRETPARATRYLSAVSAFRVRISGAKRCDDAGCCIEAMTRDAGRVIGEEVD